MKLGYCFPPVSNLQHVMFVSIFNVRYHSCPPGGGNATSKPRGKNSRKRMCRNLFWFFFSYVLISVEENVRSWTVYLSPRCQNALREPRETGGSSSEPRCPADGPAAPWTRGRRQAVSAQKTCFKRFHGETK